MMGSWSDGAGAKRSDRAGRAAASPGDRRTATNRPVSLRGAESLSTRTEGGRMCHTVGLVAGRCLAMGKSSVARIGREQ